MMLTGFIILPLLVFGCAIAKDDITDKMDTEKPAINSARILASKFSLSQYAVESMNYVIEYSLYNVGDKAALKVTLDDRNSFPTQSFEIVKGMLNVRWERINPGENATHSVVIRPRSYGTFNYTAAMITYYPTEDAREVRVGYTTSPGEGHIYRLKDYERRFNSKIGAWIIFLLFALPTTAVPFSIWYKLQAKYAVKTTGAVKKAQ